MNTNFPNGYVVLPLEEYDKMRETIESQRHLLDTLVTLSTSYNGEEVRADINVGTVYAIASSKFAEDEDLVVNYNLNDKSDVIFWSSALATLKTVGEILEQTEE